MLNNIVHIWGIVSHPGTHSDEKVKTNRRFALYHFISPVPHLWKDESLQVAVQFVRLVALHHCVPHYLQDKGKINQTRCKFASCQPTVTVGQTYLIETVLPQVLSASD